jgi:hypothetical protein
LNSSEVKIKEELEEEEEKYNVVDPSNYDEDPLAR